MSLNYLCLSEQDQCDYYGCKKPNDQNYCDNGLLCECKDGLVRPKPQMPMCVGKCPICFKWFTSFPFPSAFSRSTHFPAQASMCISVWGMWILAFILRAWRGPWVRAGEEVHVPLHSHWAPSFTQKKQCEKLYSVMCHFGVEEAVSENYPEITLFWSNVFRYLQCTEQEAMPSDEQRDSWLHMPARLQGR